MHQPRKHRHIRSVSESWAIFEAWLIDNCLDLYYCLNPPIQENELDILEYSLGGIKLPEDFKQSLRIHNGQIKYWLINGFVYLKSDEIVPQWRRNFKNSMLSNNKSAFSDRRIKSNYWSTPNWIPFCYNGNDGFYCIDLDPSFWGNYGQVIIIWNNNQSRDVIASSFRELFADYVDGVIDGTYVFSKKDFGIINRFEI